jgi:DNA-binding NtrC family response regulator
MTPRGKILAIDDEVNIRRLLTDELTQEGFMVKTAETGEQGLALASRDCFDLALVDLQLPGMTGIDVIKEIKSMPIPLDVIVITGHGNMEMAVQSMKLGARDFLTKPFKFSELIPLIDRTMKRKRSEDPGGEPPSPSGNGKSDSLVMCPSRAMQEIYQQIAKVAPTDASVLIQGETGVGKDVIAREIHARSTRKDKPFVVIDCGMLNENLAESELSGHRKGAFSGALEHKPGLIPASDGGTLFLDEIGNIEMGIQKKLLRFLETKTYRRVGDTREIPVDTRVICATNIHLADAVRKGAYRGDLLYRMDVICILIPPLRKRPEDIPLLVEHFVKDNAASSSGPCMRVSSRAMDLLTQYPWPGNVRELKSVIFKTRILAASSVIEPDDLPCLIASKDPRTEAFEKSLHELEKDHIVRILQEVSGNQSKAAKALGINRRTLYNKIRKHNIFA